MGGLGGGAQRISVLEMSADGTAIESEEEYFTNFGRLRDLCVNPTTGAIYLATNGPGYPGSGPNRIIEYRNLDFVNSTNTPTLNNQFVKVFPNPMGATGQIEFSNSFIGHQYELISFNGKIVASETIDRNIVDVNTKQLPAGSYYVKASNDLGTITKVFVVK